MYISGLSFLEYNINSKPKKQAPTPMGNYHCKEINFRQKDLLKLSQETILNKIKKSVANSQNFIGEGGEATVYKISGTSYCIRIPACWKLKHSFQKDKPLIDLNITPKDKVNHIVAKFGKDISKYPAIMPILTDIKLSLDKFLEKIVKMPQKAYDKLFIQICQARKQGMILDPYWQNILINDKKEEIIAIDFYSNNFEHSPLDLLQDALTGVGGGDESLSFSATKDCAKKILKSALKDFKPKSKLPIDIEEYEFDKYIDKIRYRNGIDTYEHTKELQAKFKELSELKKQELQGENVQKKLTDTINVIINLIDLYMK